MPDTAESLLVDCLAPDLMMGARKLLNGAHAGDYVLKCGLLLPDNDVRMTCLLNHNDGYSTQWRAFIEADGLVYAIICCGSCQNAFRTGTVRRDNLRKVLHQAKEDGYCIPARQWPRPELAAPTEALSDYDATEALLAETAELMR